MNSLEKSVKEHERIFSQVPISPENIDYAVANRYLLLLELINFRNKLTGDVIFTLKGKKQEGLNISCREKQVLSMIASGMKSKEIADKLFISANTVNNHRRNLIEKLNVPNSSEAVKLTSKLQLI